MAKAKSYEATGTLHVKYETESVTATFSKREFVLKIEDGNYPQFVKFQLVKDRCELLEAYPVGVEITVHFDLRGKESNGKYWSSLNAWKLAGNITHPNEPIKKSEPATADEQSDFPSDQLPF